MDPIDEEQRIADEQRSLMMCGHRADSIVDGAPECQRCRLLPGDAYKTVAAETARPPVAMPDGTLVDPDTGEIVGVVGKPKFAVTDEASLLWWLSRLQRKDSEIEALEGNADYLAAQAVLKSEEVINAHKIVGNVQAKAKRLKTGRDRFYEWQRALATNVVARMLKDQGGKGRTIYTPFGAAGLTAQAAEVVVREGVTTKQSQHWGADAYSLADLFAWALNTCPGAVEQSFEFDIHRLPADLRTPFVTEEQAEGEDDPRTVAHLPNDLPDALFAVTQPYDKLNVKTGVTEPPASKKRGTK